MQSKPPGSYQTIGITLIADALMREESTGIVTTIPPTTMLRCAPLSVFLPLELDSRNPHAEAD